MLPIIHNYRFRLIHTHENYHIKLLAVVLKKVTGYDCKVTRYNYLAKTTDAGVNHAYFYPCDPHEVETKTQSC